MRIDECQSCGGYVHHKHHKKRRSQRGGDGDENLLALCAECHRVIHAARKLENTARDSHASIATGGMIQWTEPELQMLLRLKGLAPRSPRVTATISKALSVSP